MEKDHIREERIRKKQLSKLRKEKRAETVIARQQLAVEQWRLRVVKRHIFETVIYPNVSKTDIEKIAILIDFIESYCWTDDVTDDKMVLILKKAIETNMLNCDNVNYKALVPLRSRDHRRYNIGRTEEDRLERDEYYRNSRDEYSIITLACQYNFIKSLKLLVSIGANVFMHYGNNGYTIVHLACFNNYLKILQYLILIGVDVNERTQDGSTPLYNLSYTCGMDTDAISYLLQHPDIDPNLQCNSETPLECAVRFSNGKLLTMIAEHPKTLISANLILWCQYIKQKELGINSPNDDMFDEHWMAYNTDTLASANALLPFI